MPRQRHEPSTERRAEVAALVSFGIDRAAVARHLRISVPTLRKHYDRELETGATAANARVAGALFELAMSGNVTAQIFWLKTRARWTERAPEAAAPLVPRADLGGIDQAGRDAIRAAIEAQLPPVTRPVPQTFGYKKEVLR